MSEFDFIKKLRARVHDSSRAVVGIGDDCAVYKSSDSTKELLFSTDSLCAGIHFQIPWAPYRQWGKKSVLVNVSDIAAMGGVPVALLTSLCADAEHQPHLLEVMEGVQGECRRFGIDLIGGNTSSLQQGLVIQQTIIGEIKSGEAVRRDGAKPGDLIFCTGTIGDAGAGLALFQKNSVDAAGQWLQDRFLSPTPRIGVGQALVQAGIAHAMIDVSDGLLQDLHHVLEASNVSAVLEMERIPLSDTFKRSGGSVADAVASGEDYELLFTVLPAEANIVKEIARLQEVAITCIGEIHAPIQGKSRIVDATGQPLAAAGFRHF